MEMFLLLAEKLCVMFLFIFVGAGLFKKGKITESGSESLANLLITLILPCVIIRSFLVVPTRQQIQYLFLSVCFSLLILILSIVIAKLLFKKDSIARFASAFSNPGFFGIPLISAVLGDAAVLYVAPFIALLNILQCTYGVAALKEEKLSINIRKLLSSPFILSFALGLFLFFFRIPLPQVIKNVITSSASLNTPIAMIVSGVYLAKVDVKAMLRTKVLYRISAVRLLLIPLAAIGLLSLLPPDFYEIKMCLLIASSCPVGTNVAVYAQLHRKNYCYAAQTVVISTLLSALTIPLFVMAAQIIWHL